MSMELIKAIREETALSIKDIKKAVDSIGATTLDQKADVIKLLREQGIMKASSRSDRATSQGSLFSYVHEGRIGVLVSIKCETDFVSRSNSFKAMGENLCLHIVANAPKYTDETQVDEVYIQSELDIAKTQLEQEGHNETKIEMILKGKRAKIVNDSCLMSQPYLMDTSMTVNNYILAISQETGEKIVVDRFVLLNLN